MMKEITLDPKEGDVYCCYDKKSDMWVNITVDKIEHEPEYYCDDIIYYRINGLDGELLAAFPKTLTVWRGDVRKYLEENE